MKKIMTALLAVIMIAGTVSIAAFADVKPITLKAPTVGASAGASVEIAITVNDVGAEGLRAARFEVKADNGLEITAKKLNPGGKKESLDVVKGSVVRFLWIAEKENQYLKSGDVLATITVKVPASAKKGDSFDIIITPSDDPGDFFGGDNFAIDDPEYGAVAQNGKITVGDGVRGDANGDGILNARDISAIMKYMLGNTPKGFSDAGADYNGDGSINARDISGIMKALLK